MSDFETPLMRDIGKLMPSVLLGLLIAIVGFVVFVIPFHGTVYGNGCSMTTSYSVAKWILESLTLQC